MVCKFDPWPGNFSVGQAQTKKEKESDVLRVGCCAIKPRRYKRTKDPTPVPRICALHDAKSGGIKLKMVVAALGGQEALPHWTSRSRLGSLESAGYDSAT